MEAYYKLDKSERGADGAVGTPGASTLQNFDNNSRPYNTITFTNSTDSTRAIQNYYLDGGAANEITVPAYPVPNRGKKYTGWKVTTAANKLADINSTVFTQQASQLLSTDTTIYTPGDKINANGIYGNVVLTAIEEYIDYTITADANCTFTVNNTSGTSPAHMGDTVTLQEAGAAPSGQYFTGFTVTRDDGAPTDITVAADGTFTMPDYNVRVKADYATSEYTVTTSMCSSLTVNGTAQTSPAPAVMKDTITVVANAPITGTNFLGFTIQTVPGGQDVTPTSYDYDQTARTATFTMPASSVSVTANYDPAQYELTVIDGTPSGNDLQAVGSIYTAVYEAEITLTAADAPAGQKGKKFEKWVFAPDGVLEAGYAATDKVVKVKMPAGPLTATATYTDEDYTVKVEPNADGTANGTASPSTAHMGALITLTHTPRIDEGLDFDYFEVNGQKINGDTFTMPDADVTVKVHYTPHNYVLNCKNGTTVTGTTGVNAEGKPTAPKGTTITLHEGAAQPGKTFSKFVVTDKDGRSVDVSLTNGIYTFAMPISDVTVDVVYDYVSYTVKVNYGTASKDGGATSAAVLQDVHVGDTITLEPADREDEGLEFKEWQVDAGGVTIANDQFTMPAGSVEVTADYKKKSYSISAKHTTVTVDGKTDAENPEVGDTVHLEADDRTKEGYRFSGFAVTCKDDDVRLTQDIPRRTGSFIMPAGKVSVEAQYEKIDYAVGVSGGTFTVTSADTGAVSGPYSSAATAQVDDAICFTADSDPENEVFTHWVFTVDGVETTDVSALLQTGSAASRTVTLKMQPKSLAAAAVYEPIATNDIVFEGECGFARVDGKRTTTAQTNKTVTITAAAQDELIFERWEMHDASGTDLTGLLDDPGAAETWFTMPGSSVTLKAYYTQAQPGEPTQSTEMISKGEAAGMAVAAVGAGIVVWQGSELAMRIYRNKTIQIDYWPGNRIALAQLIWSRAGSPEPESDAPFADITEAFNDLNDDNTTAQKAARWCVEQGLLDAKTNDDGTECFEPMKHVTHLRVCLTWQNARKMGLFEVPAEPEA